MVIYLKHPQHGTKVAISEDEASADEKNGWERFGLGVVANDEFDSLRKQYMEKFGKAPHHKKSIETLKSELAA